MERTGEQVSRELFQEKELLTALSLYQYDFGARYYDPQLGRWHVPDPADQFASPYSAMGNNPVMLTDPDGRWVFQAIGAVIGGVTGFSQTRQSGASIFEALTVGFIDAAKGAIAGEIGGVIGDIAGSAISGGSSVAGRLLSSTVGASVGGSVTGGLSASLAGGNFWQGFKAGAASGAVLGLGSGIIDELLPSPIPLEEPSEVTASTETSTPIGGWQGMLEPSTFQFQKDGSNWRAVGVEGLELELRIDRRPFNSSEVRNARFDIEVGVPIRGKDFLGYSRYFTLQEAKNSAAWASGHAAMNILKFNKGAFFGSSYQTRVRNLFVNQMQRNLRINIPGGKVSGSIRAGIKKVKPVYSYNWKSVRQWIKGSSSN